MVKILDGKKIASQILDNLKKEVLVLKKKDIIPSLAVIWLGNNLASQIFIKKKKEACQKVGIDFKLYNFKEISQEELMSLISDLNLDPDINGIVVQLPLPKKINESLVFSSILPFKDVDGFSFPNLGKLVYGNEELIPAVASAVLELLSDYKIDILGKNAVILGKSPHVGKPIGLVLSNHGATVTICDSKTENLKKITKQADILVSAVGKPNLVKKDMINPNTIVVDVGTTYISGRLVGDVDFKNVFKIVSAVSPVPGGIGPLTVAKICENIVKTIKNS